MVIFGTALLCTIVNKAFINQIEQFYNICLLYHLNAVKNPLDHFPPPMKIHDNLICDEKIRDVRVRQADSAVPKCVLNRVRKHFL